VTTDSTNWAGAAIVYEKNLFTGNEGIFLRVGGKQTNVSSFFGDTFTNMFSQNVTSVFGGTNYTNAALPLLGGYDYDVSGVKSARNTAEGNLAYLAFSSTNTSFNLYGFSQGTLIDVIGLYNHQPYSNQVEQAEVIGAGTFSLNVTTNVFPYLGFTNTVPTNYTGIAHGTVNVNTPYYLNIEGP
jgi:hypothetical protein